MDDVRVQGVASQSRQIELTANGRLTEEARRIKLAKATKEFESLFVYQLLKTMRSSVASMKSEKDAGLGSDVMLSLADEAVAGKISETDAFGISKLLLRSLDRKVEADQARKALDLKGESGPGSNPLRIRQAGSRPEFLDILSDSSSGKALPAEQRARDSGRSEGPPIRVNTADSESARPVPTRDMISDDDQSAIQGYFEEGKTESPSPSETSRHFISRREEGSGLKNILYVPTK